MKHLGFEEKGAFMKRVKRSSNSLTAKILQWLEANPVFVSFPPSSQGMGSHRFPFIVAVQTMKHKSILIRVLSAGEIIDPLQSRLFDELSRAGCSVLLARDLKGMIEELKLEGLA